MGPLAERGATCQKSLVISSTFDQWTRRETGLSKEKPTSVRDLLAKGQGLVERLRKGSAEADRALSAVREALPEGLGERVWGAAVRDGTLTVLVASAAWATRVRYHAPGLKDDVGQRLGVALERVQVRVRPRGP
jgi:hypothetical protein